MQPRLPFSPKATSTFVLMDVQILGWLAAVLIGLSLGMVGGGGSILTLPVLVYLFGIDAVTATSYSLFVVGVSSAYGAFTRWQKREIDFRAAAWFVVAAWPGVFVSRQWVLAHLPEKIGLLGLQPFSRDSLLLLLFSTLMLLAGRAMLRKKSGETQHNLPPKPHYQWILAGFGVGSLTGLLGAGGGFILVPVLVLWAGLPMKKAVGTSLFIISMNSMWGFAGDLAGFSPDWLFLAALSGLALLGMWLGQRWAQKISANWLQRIFGWLVVCMGLFMGVRELFFG